MKNKDSKAICPIVFLNNQVIQDPEINTSLILPIMNFNIDKYNSDTFEFILKQFLSSNLYDLYNSFSIGIMDYTFDICKLNIFSELSDFNMQSRAYLNKLLESSYDRIAFYSLSSDDVLSEHDNSYKEAVSSILYTVLINILDYCCQFCVSNYILKPGNRIYEESLSLCNLSDTSDSFDRKDQYVFCTNLLRQSISKVSIDIKNSCDALTISLFNIRDMYRSKINNNLLEVKD